MRMAVESGEAVGEGVEVAAVIFGQTKGASGIVAAALSVMAAPSRINIRTALSRKREAFAMVVGNKSARRLKTSALRRGLLFPSVSIRILVLLPPERLSGSEAAIAQPGRIVRIRLPSEGSRLVFGDKLSGNARIVSGNPDILHRIIAAALVTSAEPGGD